MISIKNVTKAYRKNDNVVENINLTINDGEIFGFIGANGAGKTTTIKMITGILEIDKGDILIDKKSIRKKNVEAKKRIGFVPDDPNIFLRLKGIEYLNFMADIYDVPKDERIERIKKYSKEFDMYDALEDKIQSYSHGMRQKIIIIGVLIHNPKNWILDEPLTGLDPKSSFKLKNIMREHAKNGNCVFFSTHILEVAEKLCDRIGIIDSGKIVFVGTYDEMRQKFGQEYTLEEIFMEITENEEN
jgi:ABC-2 type transport system ATP-binding protein